MKRFLTLFKIEGKLALRCPDGIIFGVIMPVGILFLIGFIAKDQQAGNSGYTFMQSAFSSLITIGICATAFMGLPMTFSDYRDKKILKHFFVTPVSPRVLLLSYGRKSLLISRRLRFRVIFDVWHRNDHCWSITFAKGYEYHLQCCLFPYVIFIRSNHSI